MKINKLEQTSFGLFSHILRNSQNSNDIKDLKCFLDISHHAVKDQRQAIDEVLDFLWERQDIFKENLGCIDDILWWTRRASTKTPSDTFFKILARLNKDMSALGKSKESALMREKSIKQGLLSYLTKNSSEKNTEQKGQETPEEDAEESTIDRIKKVLKKQKFIDSLKSDIMSLRRGVKNDVRPLCKDIKNYEDLSKHDLYGIISYHNIDFIKTTQKIFPPEVFEKLVDINDFIHHQRDPFIKNFDQLRSGFSDSQKKHILSFFIFDHMLSPDNQVVKNGMKKLLEEGVVPASLPKVKIWTANTPHWAAETANLLFYSRQKATQTLSAPKKAKFLDDLVKGGQLSSKNNLGGVLKMFYAAYGVPCPAALDAFNVEKLVSANNSSQDIVAKEKMALAVWSKENLSKVLAKIPKTTPKTQRKM